MPPKKHYVSLSPAAMLDIFEYMDNNSVSEFALMVVSGNYPIQVAISPMDTTTILTTLPCPLEPNTRILIKPVSRDKRLLGLFEVISWGVMDDETVASLKLSFQNELLERSQKLETIIGMLESPQVSVDPLDFGTKTLPVKT